MTGFTYSSNPSAPSPSSQATSSAFPPDFGERTKRNKNIKGKSMQTTNIKKKRGKNNKLNDRYGKEEEEEEEED